MKKLILLAVSLLSISAYAGVNQLVNSLEEKDVQNLIADQEDKGLRLISAKDLNNEQLYVKRGAVSKSLYSIELTFAGVTKIGNGIETTTTSVCRIDYPFMQEKKINCLTTQ